MHTFSIHTSHDTHIGFLVMIEDDDASPKKGQFALRLQTEFLSSESEKDVQAAWQALAELEKHNRVLLWHIDGDKVVLSDSENAYLGQIRQQYLRVGQYDFLLNDLTGMI